MNKRNVLALLSFLVWAFLSQAWGAELLDVSKLGVFRQAPSEPLPLSLIVDILEDPTQQLTLDDIKSQHWAARFSGWKSPNATLNFGVTPSAYWIRLRLKNTDDEPVEHMLEIPVARLAASVDFYQAIAAPHAATDSSIHTGYLSRFSERPYKYHFYAFPVTTPARTEQAVYMRLHSPVALNVPARLWQRSAFHAYERLDYSTQALYFGMVLAMMAFNLLLFFALRDTNYLIYVAFVGVTAATIAANNGIAIEFLLGEFPVLANVSTMAGASITMLLWILFMRRMIPTRTLIPRFDRFLLLLLAIHVVLPIALLLSFAETLRFAMMADGVTALAILFTGVFCAVKGERSALFFIAAFAVLCVAGLVSSLGGLGIIPPNIITRNGVQFGSALEMVVLAFALADRYNVMRAEKARAQHDALDAQTSALQAEQRRVAALRFSERQLEDRVSQRTAELSETISRLNQTQAELVQADKLASLGSLVAGVAHELNTPIGNALTTSSALEDSARELKAALDRGEMRKSTLTYFVQSAVPMAELIVRSCQRAAVLISSFKQVAVDQTSEKRRVFDLRSLVEDNVAALRPSFRTSPWVIEVDVPSDVSCDSFPGPLGQILSNLVQNAVVHAFDGRPSGTLLIKAEKLGDKIEMIFADDGKGISDAALHHIFEPFYTTRFGKGGSGLGLSVARNIATSVLGGSLQATSSEGKGTCFTLKIPVVAPLR